MKFFSQALLMLGILGGIGNEVYSMQTVPQVLSWENWAFSVVDKANPLRLPIKYAAEATVIGKSLAEAAYKAYLKKKFTPDLSSSLFKTFGFVALTISPWVIYRIWFKNFYNNQMYIYATIRDIIKKHFEAYVLNNISCTSCFNQSKLMYATEKAMVKGIVKTLRTTSTVYLCPDDRLINLVNVFYANLEAGQPCLAEFTAIQNHCIGILP